MLGPRSTRHIRNTRTIRDAFQSGLISRDQAYRQCMSYAMRSGHPRPWDLLATMMRLAVR